MTTKPKKRKIITEFMLPADYARAVGLTKQRVSQLKANGRYEIKRIGRREFIRDKQPIAEKG